MLILNLILGLFLLLQTTLFCSFSWLSDFIVGFPGGSAVQNPPVKQDTGVLFLAQEDPWRRKWHPTPVFLPSKSRGRGALQDTVHGSQRVRHYLVTKEQTHHCT